MMQQHPPVLFRDLDLHRGYNALFQAHDLSIYYGDAVYV